MIVGVLRGGWSLERSVSLRSGARIEGALRRLGHEPVPLDLDRELAPRLAAPRPRRGRSSRCTAPAAMTAAAQGLLERLRGALHRLGAGRRGDRVRQAADEAAVRGGRAADAAVRRDLEPTRCATSACSRRCPSCSSRSGSPVVVKPARGGSALGIRLARDADEVSVALSVALAYDREAIVERFVDGRDLAVSLIEVDGALVALPVVEARPRERSFYDFEARYTPGATVFDAPADLAPEAAGEAQRLAVAACELLGLRGPARIDLMLDGDGALWLLEANAVPGMTDTSLLPLAAEAAGMGFDELVAILLGAAPRQLTSPLATRARAELSSSPWPVATSRSSCSATSRVTAIGSPWRSASASAIFRSFRCSAIRKPSGYSFADHVLRAVLEDPRARRAAAQGGGRAPRAAGPRARPARAPRRAPRRCRRSAPG